jgi:hypothetical protein
MGRGGGGHFKLRLSEGNCWVRANGVNSLLESDYYYLSSGHGANLHVKTQAGRSVRSFNTCKMPVSGKSSDRNVIAVYV